MAEFEKFKEDRELLIQVIRNQTKIAQLLNFQGRKIDACLKILNPEQEYLGFDHLDDLSAILLSENESLLGDVYIKADKLRNEY